MNRFAEKIALVTGAASGIGRATALRLAQEGASVACIDVDAAGLDETVKQIHALDRRALSVQCDVSDESAVQHAMQQAIDRFGKLDVLCNCAGILRADNSHELKLTDWNRILTVNLTGTFLMCRSAIPHLLETRGNIVNMSSTSALGSHPLMAAYAASKGGILSFTRVLAIEYVKQGLRANCICPGGIQTPLHGQLQFPKGSDFGLLRRAMPWSDFGHPDQVASAVAFLASDDASYMTGIDFRLDGGALS